MFRPRHRRGLEGCAALAGGLLIASFAHAQVPTAHATYQAATGDETTTPGVVALPALREGNPRARASSTESGPRSSQALHISATFTVTTTADSVPGSLRAAINSANSA